MNGSKKYRNFSFLVYPEGLSDDFLEVLLGSGGKGFYILHDKDVLEDGSDKKPHYHVLLMFDNPRSLTSVVKLAVKVGAANGVVEPTKSSIGYARYLCHMDSPDKYQYDPDEVLSFGEIDYLGFCETAVDRNKKSRVEVVRQIVAFICDNSIYSYAELFEYCCDYRQDWLNVLLVPSVGRSVIEYIKSKTWTYNLNNK